MSGPTSDWARSTSSAGFVASSASNALARREAGGFVRATTSTSAGHRRFERGAERRPIVDEHEPGREQRDDRLELGEILGDQRIGAETGA